ncbi:hypothetical protein ACFVYP_06910 [Kitasatospora sp. NPDC058201]|uniref:hypothetical protein n=1 Tax=unclassified Kitasatospora TaxID=2633591 RepID=UPI0036644D66
MNQPQPADVDLPDALVAYFAQRETARHNAVVEILTGLNERERLLVKEAAVMGWVQGMRHHGLAIPKDRHILATVVDACLSNADLYPTITNYAPEQES